MFSFEYFTGKLVPKATAISMELWRSGQLYLDLGTTTTIVPPPRQPGEKIPNPEFEIFTTPKSDLVPGQVYALKISEIDENILFHRIRHIGPIKLYFWGSRFFVIRLISPAGIGEPLEADFELHDHLDFTIDGDGECN